MICALENGQYWKAETTDLLVHGERDSECLHTKDRVDNLILLT